VLQGDDEEEPDHQQDGGGDRPGVARAQAGGMDGGQVRRLDADGRAQPSGDAEARDVAQETVRLLAPVARRERQEDRGDPDRERRDQAQVTGQERIRDRGNPERQDQQSGEHRLRDEELGHPLHVAQRLAPLGEQGGDRPKFAADEHEVSDRRRHVGPAALRDREPRRFSAGTSLTPSPTIAT
jgi:hypothetical protein